MQYFIGTTSQDMAISSDFFKQYIKLFNPLAYSDILDYTVNLVAFNGLDTNATTSMYVKINKPPDGGSCKVDPLQGEAMSTQFFIECWDWNDPEGIGIRY